ncbi:CDP-alcohol phosphatidyltransferase family protein [Citreimonas salinaria]|uniref:CDP-diacylglycerol---serine O-phosphatidyltransferase n=1 Tax=Citreimonas salinaria TaxID=321339 RepID=A0A1H3GVS3_9RHOB|nr:phosphatidylcholine/phosphatidylserine synthase [Citreimonas salinaria]SDY06748.1 CDP-diacylglycerol---serine O-phosphatidyltransferase [Citreimonas salinaria]
MANGPSGTPEREQSPLSILMLLPNMVTLTGLSFGLTAVRFTIEGRYSAAVFLILLAALADGLDGLLARWLRAESPLGAQLDSLSDFMCFGVAPAILVYQIHLAQAGGFGWIIAMLFAVGACFRLARFNVTTGKTDDTKGPAKHFVGVPAPAGACLGLLPVFLTLGSVLEPGDAPVVVSVWLAIVCVLMISSLKTLSPKAVKVPRRFIGVILFATVIVIGLGFTRPWYLLALVDVAYLMTLLHAVVRARGQLFR